MVAAVRWDEESVARPALPLGELVQPWPVVAMAVLALNDHVLKGAGLLPAWLTGKLSDFAGIFFFPLLCTALPDTLLALGRAPVDPTLRMGKALLACMTTGIGFAAIELSPALAAVYAGVVSALGIPSRSTADPTDLFALVMLPLALAVARRHVRRVPNGRVAWALARRRSAGVPCALTLADVGRLARTDAERLAVAQLAAGLEEVVSGGSPARADRALSSLRDRQKP